MQFSFGIEIVLRQITYFLAIEIHSLFSMSIKSKKKIIFTYIAHVRFN